MMNIVRLPDNLLAVNAAIRSAPLQGRVPGALIPEYGGTIHSGYNEVIAQVAPGISGKISLTFEMAFPSVTASDFSQLRLALAPILGPLAQKIDTAAGLVSVPPPESTHMAAYAAQLLSKVLFDGKDVTQADCEFAPPDSSTGVPYRTLLLVRRQEVETIKMSGALNVEAELTGKTAKVYVPITAISFSDGLVIPFAGYAQDGLVSANGTYAAVAIPHDIWTK